MTPERPVASEEQYADLFAAREDKHGWPRAVAPGRQCGSAESSR